MKPVPQLDCSAVQLISFFFVPKISFIHFESNKGQEKLRYFVPKAVCTPKMGAPDADLEAIFLLIFGLQFIG